MSGIASIYHLDGRSVERARVAKLVDAVRPRGPDGTGSWSEGSVGLAQAMLHTTPESLSEPQPVVDRGRQLAIVFDGRLDNRPELAAALGLDDSELRQTGDAALVTRAYGRWGEESPLRLLGDFAFVIWDRTKRRLFCARDVLGIKPFYYHSNGRVFIGASSMAAVVVGAGLRRRPNAGMVAEFLANAVTSQEETLLSGILRLPAAHALSVEPEGLRKFRYWEVDLRRQIRYRTPDQYVEHFESLFQEAVRCRLRSQVPVAAELSGGLDSSSVAAVADRLSTEQVGRGIQAFSMVFPGWACDESRYSRAVVSHSGLSHATTPVALPSQSFYLEHAEAHHDLPGSPNTHMSRNLNAAARERGCRVLLTGLGGDEWFAGSPFRYADDLRRLRLARCVRQIRAACGGLRVRDAVRYHWKYGVRPLTPWYLRRGVNTLLGRLPRRGFVADGFARQVGLADRIGAPSGRQAGSYATQDGHDTLSKGDWSWGNEVDERFTAEQGLEKRHPFHDRRLIEFALSIPADEHWDDGQGKRLLRQSMGGVLPSAVRYRQTKVNFSEVFAQTFNQHGGKILFDCLEMADQGWVDVEAAQEAYQQIYRDSRATYYHDVTLLWKVYGLDLWYRALTSTCVSEVRSGPAEQGKEDADEDV